MRNDAGNWGDRNRLYELKFVCRLVSLYSSQTRGDRVDHKEIPLMQCETIPKIGLGRIGRLYELNA